MKNSLLYIVIFLLLSIIHVNAQNSHVQDIHFSQLSVNKENNQIIIKLNIKLDSLHIKSTEMITLTPVIRSSDSLITKSFNPVVITGNNKSKVLNRSLGLNNYHFDETPQQIIKHKNNQEQTIPLKLQLPYDSWVRDAELLIYEKNEGCACKNEGVNRLTLLASLFPPVYNPVYELCYITPPVEDVKARSEKYAAHLNFKVAKYDLLYDFGENARILGEVNSIISEINNDSNLKVTEFSITGYASPEGNYNSNMKLSENRAHTFVNYLRDKYGINPEMLKTTWEGEDWYGLREMVDSSFITDKDDIISIIDNEDDIAKRKTKLKKLSNGSTYKKLLNEYYPFLRRNEYTISYIVRPFTVEEAKEIIKTKPQHLSQNEMFMVANTYPKNSNEFKEVFDIIARYYPDNTIVKANNATIELEYKNWDAALRQLESINENIPEVWNNIGYIYIQKEDYKKAKEYFKKAADAKLDCAVNNIAELKKWQDSNP